MKVLLYNFALPDDTHASPGGVGVYIRDLAAALRARGAEVTLLASGSDYSPWSRKPFLAFSKLNGFQQAKLINSPVVAPAWDNFFAPEVYLRNTELDTFPSLLKEQFGDFDVMHFQNIEGLTAGFFQQARKVFANSTIILSAHNYNLVCPQVNLWKNDRLSCVDYEEGHACVSCIPFRTAEFRKQVRAAWWLRAKTKYLPALVKTRLFRRQGLPDEGDIHRLVRLDPGMKIFRTADLARDFRAFRATNIELAATSFDHVLAVSGRTRQVLLNHGLHSRNLVTSYIGSTHVETASAMRRRETFGDTLHIAYLGYARRDKGFNFLLRSLEALPAGIAKRLVFTVATRLYDDYFIKRLGRLGRTLRSVNLINGYDRNGIPALLTDVDLGIIPPVWEDNLPQVAIEIVANGVPILTSDAGGASEIGGNGDFVFTASSASSFTEALRKILDKEVPLASFWKQEPNLRSFGEHLDELLPLYAGAPAQA